MTVTRIHLHVSEVDRMEVMDRPNRDGASLRLGTETIIDLAPLAVAQLQSLLTDYIVARTKVVAIDSRRPLASPPPTGGNAA